MKNRFEYDGMFTGWAYEIKDDPREIYYGLKKIDYKTSDIDTQNRLSSSIDSMEDCFNKLELIDGTWYEIYFDGIYTLRRKAYNAHVAVNGGPSRYTPGKACDYILIEEDGEEIAYAEEQIPDDATEEMADWDPERVHRLVCQVREG